MEPVAKMTNIRYAAVMLVAVFLLFSCRTAPDGPVIVVQDPLVLQEIAPLPRTVVLARPVVSEFEPVFATFRIVEVAEEHGVQRFFLVRMGSDRAGIGVGVTGEIAEDEGFQRIIGTYRISGLYSDFFRGEITDLTHRIGANAFVRVQTGERLREIALN